MKFSVFTASTPDWGPEEAAQTLAKQGWNGIEWRITDQGDAETPGFWAGNLATWPLTGLEGNIERIAAITQEAGLEYSGIGGYAKSYEHVDVERMLAATAALGAGQVRVTMPALGTGHYRELFTGARADLEWVAERAGEHGVKALIELHHGTITSSASAAIRLVDGLDPAHIGVIHDSGNLVIEGREDYTAAFEMLGDYLAHVHVKNALWQRADAPGGGASASGAAKWEHRWATLRDGQADLQGYFDALIAHGYDGWVTLEDFSTELPLEQRARENLAYVRGLEARAKA